MVLEQTAWDSLSWLWGSPQPCLGSFQEQVSHWGSHLSVLPSLINGIKYCTPKLQLILNPSLCSHMEAAGRMCEEKSWFLGMSQPGGHV